MNGQKPCPQSKANMSRRDFLRLSALAASGTVLAACVPAASPGGESGAEPAEQSSELSVWMFGLDPDFIAYTESDIIPDFNDIHPNVTVEIEHVPYDGYRQKLATSIIADTLPGVHEAGTQAAGRVATSGEGMPLDDIIDAWDDWDDYFEANRQGTMYAGYTWGVPSHSSPSLVLYWKSKFEEAGLDPEAPPLTDVDYLEYAKVLQQVDGDRTITLGGWAPSNWRSLFQEFEVQLQRLGGQIANEDYTEVLFDSAEGEAALGWLVELFQNVYPEGVARLPDEEGMPMPHFPNQNIAMHMRAHGSQPRDVLRFNPDAWEDLEFTTPLVAKDGSGRKNAISWRNFLSVSPTTPDPVAAAEFCRVFSNTTHNVEYAKWGGRIPVRKSALESAWVKESEYVGLYLEMASPYGYDVINPPGYFEMRQKGGNFFEEAALGKISVSEAIGKCAEVWREGLSNAPSIKV